MSHYSINHRIVGDRWKEFQRSPKASPCPRAGETTCILIQNLFNLFLKSSYACHDCSPATRWHPAWSLFRDLVNSKTVRKLRIVKERFQEKITAKEWSQSYFKTLGFLFLHAPQLWFFSYVCSLRGPELGCLGSILVKLWQPVLQRTERYSDDLYLMIDWVF